MPFSKRTLFRAAAAVIVVALAVLAFTLGPGFTQSGRAGGKNMPTPGVDFGGTAYQLLVNVNKIGDLTASHIPE